VLIDAHRQAGLYVLVAWVLRIAVRLRVGMAEAARDMPRALRWAAKAAHAALYAVLLVLTLLGWAGTSAHGVPLRLFGALPLPNLVDDDPDLADMLTDWHLWTAWLLLGLVVAHVSAACWHHFVRRDDVLRAMLPWLARRRRAAPPPQAEPGGPADSPLLQ
jgi:cytochrome b561